MYVTDTSVQLWCFHLLHPLGAPIWCPNLVSQLVLPLVPPLGAPTLCPNWCTHVKQSPGAPHGALLGAANWCTYLLPPLGASTSYTHLVLPFGYPYSVQPRTHNEGNYSFCTSVQQTWYLWNIIPKDKEFNTQDFQDKQTDKSIHTKVIFSTPKLSAEVN